MNYTEFLSTISFEFGLWGNTLREYTIALGVFILFVIAFKIIQWIILSKLSQIAKNTKTDIDDTFIQIVKSLRPPFYYFLAFFVATQFLALSTIVAKTIAVILLVWIVYQIVIALQILIDYVVGKRLSRVSEGAESEELMRLLGSIAKWVLWIVGALMILSNLGINVTSLVAGLGIGGIAIALALQNILNDLFSSFSIYFDKPFKVGDYVVVGKHSGVVQKIGIKTTRIKALQGEEIVISNQELTSARLQNFKKLTERRIVFTLGVLYETSPQKLKDIPKMITDIVKSVSGVRLDRVHLLTFGPSSLDYEIVYYVESGEFGDYADRQQDLNLKIIEVFKNEGIEFAYPTQTLYVQK